MKRQSIQPYLLTALFLFLTLNLPQKQINALRYHFIALSAAPWGAAQTLRSGFAPKLSSEKKQQLENVEAENLLLKETIQDMQAYLLEEKKLQELAEVVKTFAPDFDTRRREEITQLCKLHSHGIVGKVIYRDPALWSSFVWLSVGSNTGPIEKNTPVLSQNGYLVGVVEEVFATCSKVRLITDKRLVCAVRVLRGEAQEQFYSEAIDLILPFLEEKKDLFTNLSEKTSLINTLERLKDKLQKEEFSSLLAKGELYGTSAPLWRCSGLFLEGIGFNYDFSDEEGNSRALRSSQNLSETPILNTGDLLVTSGYDGIFPAGIKVAVITKVNPLIEGACSYSIEAKACETRLLNLEYLTLLPRRFWLER